MNKEFTMEVQTTPAAQLETARAIKPAVVTVGDELIFGERDDDNKKWLLGLLQERGHGAEVALTLPDSVVTIAKWLQTLLAARCFPILVSGGIGGTHDDCTREGIAKALNVPLARHQTCFEILAAKYGPQFTVGRQRMATLPEGCDLIANPIGAPGFFLGGIYAFPGFPIMLNAMVTQVLDALLPDLTGNRLLVREFVLPLSEGMIAYDMETFAGQHPEVRLGLYPHAEGFPQAVTVRLRYDPLHPQIIVRFEELLANIKRKHQLS
jgi:molybdopterin-biosynthesis enzyme MoeA-like protein